MTSTYDIYESTFIPKGKASCCGLVLHPDEHQSQVQQFLSMLGRASFVVTETEYVC